MFARPPLLPILASCCSVAVVAALMITPIFVSHDEPPGEAVRFWWARIAPMSYAPFALRSVRVFAVPNRPDFCTSPESPLAAWRRISAHPQAEALFAHLLIGPRPSTRLYALAGLAQVNSTGFASALARARADTSHMLVWINTHVPTTVQVAQLVSERAAHAWAHALNHPGIACAA